MVEKVKLSVDAVKRRMSVPSVILMMMAIGLGFCFLSL